MLECNKKELAQYCQRLHCEQVDQNTDDVRGFNQKKMKMILCQGRNNPWDINMLR